MFKKCLNLIIWFKKHWKKILKIEIDYLIFLKIYYDFL